jgi:cell division protein FtsI/penicillin-binding protein 2
LLGSFGEVTAEIVKASDGRYRAGDRAGISGLQRSYDTVLAGAPGVKVTTSSGKVLFEKEAEDGADVQLTLDSRVQRAAEAALAASGDVPSALVAIDVKTGDVLASANHPWYGFDRADTGQFPPGSTFKIVSTYSLLSRDKVSLDESVSCPASFTVDGRAFRNYEGETLGSPTFTDDFVHSCNTAFVQLSTRLGDGDLNAAAETLGLGAGWGSTFGVANAFDGSVPENTGKTDKAAATIGQGRNLVSPLAMATVVGSVARGSYVPPLLVASPATEGAPDRTPVPLDETVVANLRTVMRGVVTGGTATVMASTPGGPVSGKTGTAEFGSADPPKTHAWFVGFQGNLAFAVLVEEGTSGGSVAAPIAKAFLTTLAG